MGKCLPRRASKLTLGKTEKRAIDIYGDGSVIRDFIFIDDVIRALQKIV